MAARRKEVQALLKDGEAILSITHFPLMGVNDWTQPHYPVGGPVARSLFVPDEAINVHKRFGTLTRNIRERRGRKIDINVPIFRDQLTQFPNPTIDELDGNQCHSLAGHVFADAMLVVS
jgi:glutamate--cysteine ligase catalytic subunit